MNLFGVQFILGGSDITGSLTPDIPLTITNRNVRLEGILADGSPFSFDLNSSNPNTGADHFSTLAILTITLVVPGDSNHDGDVNAADYIVWRKNSRMQAGYDTWRANFGATTAGTGSSSGEVPETTAAVSLLLGLVLTIAKASRPKLELVRRHHATDHASPSRSVKHTSYGLSMRL